jgi:membrane dipeptidase
MKLIDLHADTLTALYYDPTVSGIAQEFVNTNTHHRLDNNSLQIDLNKLRQADSLAQFFVLWLNLKKCEEHNITAWQLFIKQYNELINQLNLHTDKISLVTNLIELEHNQQQNKLSAFACVEEGAFITEISQLKTAYDLGIRYITLVWNYETHIGTPSAIDQSIGLKKFGFEMVEQMQNLGIMVDVSHLSDQGVSDVLSISRKPIIASHSNARALCKHTRNLPDALIKNIATHDGIIGVNCVPHFLKDNNIDIKYEYLIQHIKHIYNLAGIDSLAIGNDFDGFRIKPEAQNEIKGIADLPLLATKLIQEGFSQSQIEQIFYKNALRVIKHNFN